MSYSTIAWATSLHKGMQPNAQYSYTEKNTAGKVFNFFSALGDVAFANEGHNAVLEIQATIPSTPEKASKGPMWRGVIVAHIVVALCYFPASLIGYWIFGNNVQDNIFISLEKPTWLIAMANMFVVIHVIGSYQTFTMFVGITFPFFGGLLGFFEEAFAAITYFLPCIMWLVIYKPRRFSLSWVTNWG
ncbi:unnamed protein product [Camellia sinensis]